MERALPVIVMGFRKKEDEVNESDDDDSAVVNVGDGQSFPPSLNGSLFLLAAASSIPLFTTRSWSEDSPKK
jgi:hypothetical protein